jgi:5-methylcytosine-specific restriction endonuclease McrA
MTAWPEDPCFRCGTVTRSWFTTLGVRCCPACADALTPAVDGKPCCACDRFLSLSAFPIDKQSGKPWGKCLDCRREDRRQQGKRRPKRKYAHRKRPPGYSARTNRRWRQRHPDKARLTHQVAAQLRRSGLRNAIFARDGRRCLVCSATVDLVIDHIRPVLNGGTNDPSNLQVLCRACNSRKRGAVDHRSKPPSDRDSPTAEI